MKIKELKDLIEQAKLWVPKYIQLGEYGKADRLVANIIKLKRLYKQKKRNLRP